jgi:hypothetical protein
MFLSYGPGRWITTTSLQPPLDYIMNQYSTVHTLIHYFSNINLDIIFPFD